MNRLILLLLAVFCAPLATGCRPAAQPDASETANAQRREFIVKGVIKQLTPGETRVVIVHEEIPDYMAAMTMPFRARTTNELAGLSAGDAVEFRYVVLPRETWIDQVRRLDPPAPVVGAEGAVFRPWVDALRPGDEFPFLAFTNHSGRALRLSELKGRPLVLSFISTRADGTPEQARLIDALKGLTTEQPDGSPAGRVVLVTTDPVHDTPEILAGFARRHGLDDSNWQLLTGAPETSDQLLTSAGVVVRDGAFNARALVFGADGKMTVGLRGTNWVSEAVLREALAGAATPEGARP